MLQGATVPPPVLAILDRSCRDWARLTEQKQELVFDWTQSERLRLIMQDAQSTQ